MKWRQLARARIIGSVTSVLVLIAALIMLKPGRDRPETAASLSQAAYQHLWEGDRASAEQLFREALKKDPASPYRWCDMGHALMLSSRYAEAQQCFTRAAELAPNSPPVLIRVANFHFNAGETVDALRYTSRTLRLTDKYDNVIFGLYDRLVNGAEVVLRDGMPDDRRAARSWFRYLQHQNRVKDADKTWRWLTSHSLVDDRVAGEYVDLLLANGRYEEAASNWKGYLGKRAGDYLARNLVFNSGFECTPLETKLDWTFHPVAGADISRDANAARSGAASLRIQFAGSENVDFHHVVQTVVVSHGKYRFSAYVRTVSITTDRGLGFRIFDAAKPSRFDVRIGGVTGTQDWVALEKTIVVPPGTGPLAIQVTRIPSGKFDNKIGGTAWIDDVVLKPDHRS
jgi:tetratricopeptide (TPR) repeat protein